MAERFRLPVEALLDTDVNALAGGSIAFYDTLTTTLKAIYTDDDNLIPANNPLTLDSVGQHGNIFLGSGDYRLIVKNASGSIVPGGDIDPIHGGGAVSGITILSYANIATLAAVPKGGLVDGQQTMVSGYTTAGDGGGGAFYWDAASTTAANGGTVFEADDGGAGRWTRVFSGPVDIRWFGAVEGGAGDQGPAINLAIAAAPATVGWEIYATGKYRTATQIAFNKKCTMRGAGHSENSGNGSATEILKASTMTTPAIKITSPAVHLDNFAVEGEAGNTGDGIEISGESNSTALSYISVHNQGRHGINIGAALNSGHQNLLRLTHIVCHSNGDAEPGDGIHIDYGAASTNCNTGTLTGFHCFLNSRDGLNIDGAGGWSVVGGSTELNMRYGLYLGPNSSKNTFWGGVYGENNTIKDVYLDTGAEQNWIIGSAFLAAETTDLGTETFIASVDKPFTKVSSTNVNSVATGTTVIPRDDTIPITSNGDLYMTLSDVKRQTGDAGHYEIKVVCHLSSSVANHMTAALFMNDVAAAIAAGHGRVAGAGDVVCVTFTYQMLAPAGLTTFKVRAGGSAAGTTTFNGSAGVRLFGGVIQSSIQVLEAT